MKTEGFYMVKDVMNLMHICQSGAYGLIRKLNLELAAKGFVTRSGRVPAKYFNERMGLV